MARFLTAFVATFADVERVVLKTCVMAAVSPGSPTEIATPYFRERDIFHALG